jgi:heme-degrading monooxygenase HmoA
MEQTRFARLIVMKTKRGKSRSFVDTFKSEVASTAGEIAGLRRLYLLGPADKKGEFIVLSLWDDKKSADTYTRSGRDDAYSAKLDKVLSSMNVRKCKVESHIVGQGTKDEG